MGRHRFTPLDVFTDRALAGNPLAVVHDAQGLDDARIPVTGSLNAGLAQWLIGAGLAPERYVAAQGSALGSAGHVFVERDGADVWVGGHVSACIEGSVAP